MIIKASAHRGDGLAVHLLNTQDNERVRVSEGRGLTSPDDVAAAIQRFAAETAGTRARAGMLHVSMSPEPREAMTPEGWERAWSLYEREFGLEGAAYAEVEHEKVGRVHRHRVYQRILDDRAVHLGHSYTRHEYVSRLAEWELGHDLTFGRHSLAIGARLQREGRLELLEALATAAPPAGEVIVTRLTHAEHQQEKRTGVSHADVVAVAVAAWRESDMPRAFEAALAKRGLALADGHRTPQLVDHRGGTHDVRRTVRAGGELIKARDVRERTSGLQLPTVDQVREAQRERAAEQPVPPQPPARPVSDDSGLREQWLEQQQRVAVLAKREAAAERLVSRARAHVSLYRTVNVGCRLTATLADNAEYQDDLRNLRRVRRAHRESERIQQRYVQRSTGGGRFRMLSPTHYAVQRCVDTTNQYALEQERIRKKVEEAVRLALKPVGLDRASLRRETAQRKLQERQEQLRAARWEAERERERLKEFERSAREAGVPLREPPQPKHPEFREQRPDRFGVELVRQADAQRERRIQDSLARGTGEEGIKRE